MTPQSINIAIQESLGWDMDPAETHEWGSRGQWCVWPHGGRIIMPKTMVPNYHSSLDACAEFEATMDKQEQSDYICALGGLCQEPDLDDWAGVCFATAPQRCEAYLKLKGLWKEGAK